MQNTFYIISIISISLSIICSIIIVIDMLSGHRQKMWIMNIVWPVTALYSGPIGLFAYYKIGRLSTVNNKGANAKNKPYWQSVALGASHCGSGCTIADLIAEWTLFFIPFSLFGKTIFGSWAVDYILALIIGIIFQYYTIKPMRQLTVKEGIAAAFKADILSLSAWQIGMYGWMAVVVFIFLGHEIPKTSPFFWFMMQIAMLAGFITSYPVNWWLIKSGIKEAM